MWKTTKVLSLFIVGVGLLLTMTFTYAWVMLPDKTMNRFLTLVQNDDMEAAHDMLMECSDSRFVIDDRALSAAATEGVTPCPRTLLDLLWGRREFDVHLAYANDHSLVVRQGQVFLGSAYFIYLSPGSMFQIPDHVQERNEKQ